MDPITTYYLPLIIESVGGLPEGTVIEMPTPLPSEVIMMSLAQLSSLGVLIIVLMMMGTISGEIKSGVAELILVKPITYLNYITSKWASFLLIVWVSLFVAMITSWYYINLLFGELLFLQLLQTIVFYGLWLTLVVTLAIFYNSLVQTPGLVAALTIITIVAMSIITNIFDHLLTWSPIKLSEHILEMLVFNEVSIDLVATALVTAGMIVGLLFGSVYIFKRKEMI
jgi:ABC-2 type transport system permease protein